MSILDTVEITLRNSTSNTHSVYFNVFDTPLARKWYTAFQTLLKDNYHLEKNYLWHGWANSERDGDFLCNEINKTFEAINNSKLDYHIDDHFDPDQIIIDSDDLDAHPFDHEWLLLHIQFFLLFVHLVLLRCGATLLLLLSILQADSFRLIL